MRDHLLTLNAGSSSIKFALFEADGDQTAPTVVGQADGLGLNATLKIRSAHGALLHDAALRANGSTATAHREALAAVLAWMRAHQSDVRVCAVGHRIVHGGTEFEQPVLIDDAVQAAIAGFQPLAPLHQPHNLAGVQAARAAFAGTPQVACFDTAFHRRQPDINQRFALPQALHDAGVRRYGFHGLSYESIRAQLIAADERSAQGRIVIAHLGNGASMCAMRSGESVATTMSFSPLDGLPMGTRCGRLDAAVVLYLLQHDGRSADDISRLLHRESGLLGLSGVSSDMRELLASGAQGARLAIDYFVEQVLRELAGMAAALRGIDRLVFTGGIGENAAVLRARIVEGAGWLGMKLDTPANRRGSGFISSADSLVPVQVLHTDEEAVIARHTAHLAWPQGASSAG